MKIYLDMVEETKEEFKGFKVVPKSESLLMKAINVFLIAITFGQMRTFMTRFHTTVGTTVYVTPSWDKQTDASRIITLRHERVHMRQARRYTRPVFSFLYLFALPSIWTFRAKFEAEAYEETMRAAVEFHGTGSLDDKLKASIVKHFTSAEYFWMKPFKGSVEKWFDEARKRVLAGSEE